MRETFSPDELARLSDKALKGIVADGSPRQSKSAKEVLRIRIRQRTDEHALSPSEVRHLQSKGIPVFLTLSGVWHRGSPPPTPKKRKREKQIRSFQKNDRVPHYERPEKDRVNALVISLGKLPSSALSSRLRDPDRATRNAVKILLRHRATSEAKHTSDQPSGSLSLPGKDSSKSTRGPSASRGHSPVS